MLVSKLFASVLESLKSLAAHTKTSIKTYLPALIRADEWADGRIFREELKPFPSENKGGAEENKGGAELVIYSGWFFDSRKYVYIREPFDVEDAGVRGNESNVFTLLFSRQSYIRVGPLPEILSVTEPMYEPRCFGLCQVAPAEIPSDEEVVEHLNFYLNRKGLEGRSQWWQINKCELETFPASM